LAVFNGSSDSLQRTDIGIYPRHLSQPRD